MTASAETLAYLLRVYEGSSGEATTELYTRLEVGHGVAGKLAVNLFRAQKASARAKVYRGGQRGKGSYRGMAYGRKGWAIDNLCATLAEHGEALGFGWGWGGDKATPGYENVLYVDLPTGQVSFHSPDRRAGPDYPKPWDGVCGVGPDRILRWIADILDAKRAVTITGDAA